MHNNNLFDYENYTYDKTIMNSYRFIEIKNAKANTRYTIYNYSTIDNTPYPNVYLAYEPNYQGLAFGSQLNNSAYATMLTNENGKLYLGAFTPGGWTEEKWNTFIDYFENAMVVEGTDRTSPYIPHAEQNISFPLAEGQKFMEDDYLADDGIHHMRFQKIFKGTENWKLRNGCTHTFDLGLGVTSGTGICSHYQHISSASFDQVNGIYLTYTSVAIISDLNFSNVEDFKSWLAEQYENETPVTIECTTRNIVSPIIESGTDAYTSEQQIVWEQIKKLKSYDEVTVVDSTDTIQAKLTVSALKAE